MRRASFGMGIAMMSLLVGLPVDGSAQVAVNVALRWGSVDEGWRGYRVDERDVRDVRVPRGHLPRPGFCKVWFPGRPPGHQPPASKCELLVHRYRTSGAVFGPARFADALLLVGPHRRIPIDSRDVRFIDERDDRRFVFDERDDRRFEYDERDHRGKGRGRGHR